MSLAYHYSNQNYLISSPLFRSDIITPCLLSSSNLNFIYPSTTSVHKSVLTGTFHPSRNPVSTLGHFLVVNSKRSTPLTHLLTHFSDPSVLLLVLVSVILHSLHSRLLLQFTRPLSGTYFRRFTVNTTWTSYGDPWTRSSYTTRTFGWRHRTHYSYYFTSVFLVWNFFTTLSVPLNMRNCYQRLSNSRWGSLSNYDKDLLNQNICLFKREN